MNKIAPLLILAILFTASCSLRSPFYKKGTAVQNTTSDQPPVADKSVISAEKLSWMILFSIGGVGGAVILAFLEKFKLAVALGAACITTLVLSITVSQHFKTIAFVGLGILLLIIGTAIWMAWTKRKELADKKAKLKQDEMSFRPAGHATCRSGMVMEGLSARESQVRVTLG